MTSILDPRSGPPAWVKQAFDLGTKIATDRGRVARNLSGQLYHKSGGMGDWIMLSVPNAMVRGIYQAMDEPGIELPIIGSQDKLMAHISVIRPEELESIGGPDAVIKDRGRKFSYTPGKLIEVEPKGWDEVKTCWFLRVHSPELQELRRSYGLSSLPKNGEYDFHITVAIRRRGVLSRNTKKKEQAVTSG